MFRTLLRRADWRTGSDPSPVRNRKYPSRLQGTPAVLGGCGSMATIPTPETPDMPEPPVPSPNPIPPEPGRPLTQPEIEPPDRRRNQPVEERGRKRPERA